MSLLEQIIAQGNHRSIEQVKADVPRPGNKIQCVDGFKCSVIAGPGTYCTPRPALSSRYGITPGFEDVPSTYPGPYTHVEVGFPSQRPEPWDQWKPLMDGGDDPTDTVYGYVPVQLVRDLIAAHGGERS